MTESGGDQNDDGFKIETSLHGKFGFRKVKVILFCGRSLTSSPPIYNNCGLKYFLVGFHHSDITLPQEPDAPQAS